MDEKLDLIREFKHLYNPPNRDFTFVEIPAFSFLMLDGIGDPNTAQAYKDALQALYSLAYTIKFAWKKQTGQDYRVMPLEGLWWVENLAELDFDNKYNWHWTMMIHQPAFITTEIFLAAQKAVQKKSCSDLVLSVRLEEYKEGTAVQVLYFGPFADEHPTIDAMHDYARHNGYELHRKHHEIYLSDFRRTAPEKLKTILRQPVFKPG